MGYRRPRQAQGANKHGDGQYPLEAHPAGEALHRDHRQGSPQRDEKERQPDLVEGAALRRQLQRQEEAHPLKDDVAYEGDGPGCSGCCKNG